MPKPDKIKIEAIITEKGFIYLVSDRVKSGEILIGQLSPLIDYHSIKREVEEEG